MESFAYGRLAARLLSQIVKLMQAYGLGNDQNQQ
jgi:hypothetical protein